LIYISLLLMCGFELSWRFIYRSLHCSMLNTKLIMNCVFDMYSSIGFIFGRIHNNDEGFIFLGKTKGFKYFLEEP
jgi:hypothetical protein